MFALLNPLFDAASRNRAARSCGPIGIDLGGDTIRLVQLREFNDQVGVVAAASRDVPSYASTDPVAYAEFVSESLREMRREGNFAGRRAVLSLPGDLQHWLHLRLPKLESGQIADALKFECAGKLPFDPHAALLRHHVVGDVYTDDGPRQEVLCTAARRTDVEALLGAAERARLEVVGVTAAPAALRDGFSRVYRRSNDAESGWCFVDIGQRATRVVIVRAGHLYFARTVPIGGEAFTAAVADALGVSVEEAKLLRSRLDEEDSTALAESTPARPQVPPPAQDSGDADAENASFALLGAAMRASDQRNTEAPTATRTTGATGATGVTADAAADPVGRAIANVAETLADEIDRCRRYHESAFPNVPVQRLVFVGGEANSRMLCKRLARRLGLAAQVGDLMTRMLDAEAGGIPTSRVVAAGIDRRRPQPGWSLACCLALTPTAVAARVAA